jgi:hypothetical protein
MLRRLRDLACMSAHGPSPGPTVSQTCVEVQMIYIGISYRSEVANITTPNK